MRWNVLIGLPVAVLVITVAYAAVRALHPLATRLGTQRWVTATGERGRAGLSWLTVRVAADVVILTVGAAVTLTLAAGFVEILDEVTDADDLTVIDRPVVEWLAANRTPWLNQIEIGVTDLGGAAVLILVLSATAALIARRRRSWTPVLLVLIGQGGIQLLVNVIKLVIARPRPNPPEQLVSVSGFSFPSGHSASSLVGFGLLAWLVCMVTADRTFRATAWIAAALGTVAVGTSRVYLGVHYPSDVIGGWALGLTWLAVVALAARVWRMRAPPVPPDAA